VKREAAIAGLASEGLSLISVNAGAGSSAVVGLNFFAFHTLYEPYFISGGSRRCCRAPLDIWGVLQLRTGCLSILMLLTPLAEATP